MAEQTKSNTNPPMTHSGVWCCEHQEQCKWQGFALHQGLAWGQVPQKWEGHRGWRAAHDENCTGRLIQLLPSCSKSNTAAPSCSPSDFADGDLAAVRFRDNWDGEGDICETIAQWRGGEWWPHDGGKRLLEYQGSEILQVWPLKKETALLWHEANRELRTEN